MNTSLDSRKKSVFFSVELELAVLKQRKIDCERRVFQDEETHQYFLKRNSCGYSLFGNIIEYSFRHG